MNSRLRCKLFAQRILLPAQKGSATIENWVVEKDKQGNPWYLKGEVYHNVGSRLRRVASGTTCTGEIIRMDELICETKYMVYALGKKKVPT